MREMSLKRRRVVVMASSIASMSGVGPLLLRGHRYAEMVWLAFVVVMLVLVIRQLVQLRREEGC